MEKKHPIPKLTVGTRLASFAIIRVSSLYFAQVGLVLMMAHLSLLYIG